MDNVSKELDTIAVENFRNYLRIPSVHPNINYDECVKFLKQQASDLGLLFSVHECSVKKPMVILTWIGKQPELSTVLLNSHMDVVPVVEEKWTHKPFDADIDEEGNIYARGAQDVKSLGIQYLEAIRRLKKDGFQPHRTIHVSFAPDEETGGLEGMKKFVRSEKFQNLHVGFGMDEGIPGESEFWVYHAEKITRNVVIHCMGETGHGSLLLDNTAGEKVAYLLNKFFGYRAQQKSKAVEAGNEENVISINLTMVKGGLQSNVIPPEFTIVFDTRIPPTIDIKIFEDTMRRWCTEAGTGVWMEDFLNSDEMSVAKVEDTNPFWMAFQAAVKTTNIPLKVKVLGATTDARHLRSVGVPTIGFCPHLRTPNRAHGHNEFLNVDVLLEGIEVFRKIIPAVTNV